MCGIAGILSENLSAEQIKQIVIKMNASLAHRGPDHNGIWETEGVCLGHRRLSIIDLSENANQPFFSSNKRHVIVYNGELYNYRELKLELQRSAQGSNEVPHFFKTASDTEVVLAAFLRWGKDCLRHFHGMFAFAIYDTQEKKLFAARDRMGVKPFYYHFSNDGFLFSSEIRAILHCGLKNFSLNTAALAEYVMYQTVYAPKTIVKGIQMLLPGHYLEYQKGKAELTQYYDLNKIQAQEILPYEQICAKVNELLALAVQKRMVSDVPFGAFLSGGIDSSAVVGLMSKVSSEKIQTFHVSFDESEFSESVYAKQIAKKFNTEHHEIKLQPNDFLSQLPQALKAMDHPGGDGPNTYIVSKATRNVGITMALSGIGGDELFAGYDVFKRMDELSKKTWLNAIPQFARKAAGQVIRKKSNSVGGDKKAELLAEKKITFASSYLLSRSLFTQKDLIKLLPNGDPFEQITKIVNAVGGKKDHLLSTVSLCEMQTYLQNVLLRDTDQMSMAVALEVREPFLDHKLIEYVLGIKDEWKYPHTPKKLLTDSLGDLLPSEIINRPKMGFTLPWKEWMKNELKTLCEENIQELGKRDLLNEKGLNELWNAFLMGDPKVSWSRIWHLVVLNNWIKENKLDGNL